MSSNNVILAKDEYEEMVAAAAGTVYGPSRDFSRSTSLRERLRFSCGKPGHLSKDCKNRPQVVKPAFIRPTAEQNVQFQAYLRNQQAKQDGQQGNLTTRKRWANEAEASGAPALKKSQWPPKGTKPVVAASVECDVNQFEEFIGAAGVLGADDDDDFDPEVYRPEEGYSS
jgi:hypothetical protein